MKYPSLSDTPLPFLCKSILFPLILLLLTSISSIAQTDVLRNPLQLQLGNITVAKALKAIEIQTGYEFSYSSNLIDTDREVVVSYTSTPLRQILQDILGDAARGVRVEGNQIRIQPSAGKGIVRGSVRTSDGQPARFVTVGIRGQRSTQADDHGRFMLENIEAGTYTITASYVGLQTQQQRVTVVADGTANVSFTLNEDAQTLQEVVVNGERVNRFADKETEYVARMPLDNLENPQVYSVVAKELMDQQVAVNISQAIRNATGAVPTEFDSGGLGILTRGFSTGANARNGMETATNRTSIDIANVERVEVLKGPSGTLFGSTISSYGGVVNIVTKKPFNERRTEVSYTAGSYGFNRLSVDVNTPLNAEKTALLRINGALNRENSFLDAGFNRTVFLAPSLRYQVNTRLFLSLDAELFSVNKTQPWYTLNSPAAGFKSPGDIPLPYRTNLLRESADAKSTATKAFAEAKYRLSENWTSTSLFSFTGEDIHYSYQLYTIWRSPQEMIRRVTKYGPISQNYLSLQENINGSFHTGSITHKLLIGANYRYYGSNYSTAGGIVDTVGLSDPYEPLGKAEIDPHLTESSSLIPDQHTWSAYASDVVGLTDRLSLMLSLRLDHFNHRAAGNTEAYKQTSLAPKLGLVYQVVKDQVSLFGNYMSGFQNQAPYDQPDGTRLVLDPTFANQYETGIKAETFGRKLSATASYYYIAIDDAINYTDGYAVQNGKQVSKGVEFELSASPVTGLQVIAGYVYNDNRITENADPAMVGKFAVNAPQHVANAWVSYNFRRTLRGLGIGGGVNYVGKSYLFSDNNYYIPEYTVYHATIFYDQPKWRLGLKMNNLTNKHFWGPWGMPQSTRNFAANLTLRF